MDWSNPIGAAVSGLFDIAGSALQYKYQKKLAEQQNQFNLDMWKMQNEYNSPAAQMKRFQEAGLNPNLIYGQGNAGNASSAPEMVTPNAPEFSRGMRELAQAFNIEGLRTAIANRKKAQADASIAQTAARDAADEYAGKSAIGNDFFFDDRTGRISVLPSLKAGANGIYTHNVQNAAAYYMYRTLSDNYRTNSLLVPRANLIGSQSLLNSERQKLLAPQIRMLNYQQKYQPWTFWIGNVKNAVQSVTPLLPLIP